jgi:hypothetical protein
MLENKKNKRIKFIVRLALIELPMLAMFFFIFKDRFAWAGVFCIISGILSIGRSPHFVIIILTGLFFILLAYAKYSIFLKISFFLLALLLMTILVVDMIMLIRLARSDACRIEAKSEKGKALELLRDNEITYRLWRKLKQKYRKL